jgi:hypothetical protein
MVFRNLEEYSPQTAALCWIHTLHYLHEFEAMLQVYFQPLYKTIIYDKDLYRNMLYNYFVSQPQKDDFGFAAPRWEHC